MSRSFLLHGSADCQGGAEPQHVVEVQAVEQLLLLIALFRLGRLNTGSWDLVSKAKIRITPLRGLVTPIITYLLSPLSS